MNRQQIRRQNFKSKKATEAANRDIEATAELEKLRATRQPYQLPKKHPGKLLTARRPYAKVRGKDNRSILRERIEIIPAVTTKVGRKTVVLIAERRYEHTFHATKGARRQRKVA
jgi:hypothetical protein